MHIELYLPYPPTVNNYYVKTQRGVYISQKGRKYRDTVLQSVLGQVGNIETTEARILVEVVLFSPDRRRRDVDNYMKGLLDAITQAEVWADDEQIDQLFIYRGEVRKKGQVYMRITDAGPILRDVSMLTLS